MNDIEKLAHEISGDYFYKNQLEIVGAKVIENKMYVKGFDGGFPHAVAYVQVDLDSKKIVKYYDAQGCTVDVIDGVFEQLIRKEENYKCEKLQKHILVK